MFVNQPKSISNALLFLLLFLLSACAEVIDLDTETSEEWLVVDGRITNGSFGNQVRLSFTSPINSNQRVYSGATITLFKDGAEFGQYVETEDGLYELNRADHSATAGNSYELLIELVDGTQYRSEPAIMPANAAVDVPKFEVGIIKEPIGDAGFTRDVRVVKMFTDTEILDPNDDFYLRWEVYETYIYEERQRMVGPFTPIPQPCYITNDITGRQPILFNGAELKVQTIPDVLLSTIEVDSRYIFSYLYNVVQFTTDADTYRYRSQVDGISNLEGNLFDTPPGAVLGNISNVNNPNERVLGYFEVVRSDTTWLKVVRDDIPFNVELPCPRANAFSEPESCTNCLLLENSTIVQPYYWY